MQLFLVTFYFSIFIQQLIVCIVYVLSIVFAEYMYSLLNWEWLFLQLLIITFVILCIELHVCTMMFCEINYIINKGL